MFSSALRISALSLLIICSAWQLPAQALKTFYVGHSLSDQIPDMVQSLSNDHATADFSWVYQSIPGSPLRYNWDRKYTEDYYPIEPHYYGFYDQEYGLPAGDYDVLVLTESVPRYLEIIDETYAYADSFYSYATTYNPDIQVYLYEDWHCLLSGTPTACDYDVDSNPWRQRLSDDLEMWESVVDTLNARYNPVNPICMIPAGQGLIALYDSIQAGVIPDVNEIEDLFSDNIHLTDIGKYYVACIHFAMIHKTSPVGLTNQLQVWWGGDFEAPGEMLALKMQEMAWETVMNYPKSCVNVVQSQKEESISSVVISPNPTSDYITIKGLDDTSTLQIVNAAGQSVGTKTNISAQSKISINDLSGGLYFVKIYNLNGELVAIKKLIKQ